jgi:hypothetical protein
LFNPHINLPSQSSHQLLILIIIIIIITTTTTTTTTTTITITTTIIIVVVVVVIIVVLLLFIIYIVNLHVVRPRSCRVIYYFETPALGRRHQSFDRVNYYPQDQSY